MLSPNIFRKYHSLFTVNEAIFDRIPTIAKLRRLFDNYEINSATDETTTPVEANEIHDFINTLLDTPVMQIAMDFLQSKGKHRDSCS